MNTMRTSKEDYQVFDFELRRKYAAALQEDCVLNSGVCVSTRAAEIVCREEAIPAAEIATPPTEAAKAGDANKATPAKGAKKK